jgi:hypothetical protein
MPFFFSKTEHTKVKQVLSGGWYECVDERRYKESVKEAECSRNVMYSCMKMEK